MSLHDREEVLTCTWLEQVFLIWPCKFVMFLSVLKKSIILSDKEGNFLVTSTSLNNCAILIVGLVAFMNNLYFNSGFILEISDQPLFGSQRAKFRKNCQLYLSNRALFPCLHSLI